MTQGGALRKLRGKRSCRLPLCGRGNLVACRRLSGGRTAWKAGPQAGLPAPRGSGLAAKAGRRQDRLPHSLHRAGAVIALAIFACCLAPASSSSFWEMSSFTDFIAGKLDGVALSRDGRLTPAPQLDTVFNSGQPVIWSVVQGPGGALYVATGHRGRVYRIDNNGTATPVWTADKPEVFALAANAQGDVYAASSPNGKIYRIRAGQVTEYFDPKARYIWALALAADGTLYAGTGDAGIVYRITGPAQGEPYYATGQGNVTGLMIDPQGRLLAGTEPNGILYSITAKDKAFALYDSTLPELRALAVTADGSVYAAGLGGALAKKIQATQQNQNPQQDSVPTISATVTVTAQAGGDLKPAPQEVKPQPQSQPAGTPPPSVATETPGVEKSAIYRINPDNTVDTLWSSKEENVYDILPERDGIWFGTDVNARIYRLTADRKLTLVAQTNDAETVRLLSVNDAILAATANSGKLYRLGAPGKTGSYESPTFDAGGAARWGRIRWQGDGVDIRTRSGNSLRPDTSWSDWSPAMTDASGSPVASPNARYLQFRAELTGASAHLDNIAAAFLPQNNPPVIHSITVTQQPPPAGAAARSAPSSTAAAPSYSISVTDTGDAGPVASTGTPTQTLSRAIIQQILISWQADDSDSDKLVYDVAFRGEGEDRWKSLRRDLHDNALALDGDSLADGRYYFKVTASDREANPPGSAKETEFVSSPVLIDNTPPAIRVQSSSRSGNAADIVFDAQDTASPLRRAEWSMDAGTWIPVAPVDGILDSRIEQFRLHIDNIPAGEHVLVLRVADSGGNTGLAKVVLR